MEQGQSSSDAFMHRLPVLPAILPMYPWIPMMSPYPSGLYAFSAPTATASPTVSAKATLSESRRHEVRTRISKEIKAAIMIQKTFRGYQVRKKYGDREINDIIKYKNPAKYFTASIIKEVVNVILMNGKRLIG